MRALVTGADGFIGSHLTELLLTQDFEVTALAYYNSFNSWGWLEKLADNKNLKVISGDIRDPFFCKQLTKDIDLIFHLAALIAIPYSYMAPDSYIETNVKGTLNICQAAHENKVARLIHTSTSEVYGSALYVPIDEKHPLQPQSPYSASKIGADAIAMSFVNAFNLPLTIARPFNTYGPRQSARAIIPTIITQIAQGRSVIQVGDLSPTRDFNYVADTVQGLLSLAQAGNTIGKIINIGSNYEISMQATLDIIRKLMHSSVKWQTDSQRIRPENSEVTRLWCDNTQIKELTGYTPKYSLEQGLQKTIDWFLLEENLARYKANIYNV